MRQVLNLALTIIRGSSFFNFGTDTGENVKSWKKYISAGLALFLILYAAAASGMTASVLFDLLHPAQLENLIPGLLISSLLSLSLIFSILYALSIFYHASDIDRLLPLPMTATTVIGAKLIVTLSYLYRITALFTLSPLIVFGVLNGSPWFYYPTLILIFLILPVIPLSAGLLIIFLLMRLTPLTYNKDRFKSISGVVLLFLSIGLSYSFSSMSSIPKTELVQMLATRADQIAKLTSSFFPGARQATLLLTTRSPGTLAVNLALLLIITAVSLTLILLAGQKLYFKGVIGLSSAHSEHRRLSSRAIKQQLGDTAAPFSSKLRLNSQNVAYLTYLIKDLRILFRTPIFLVNNVLMNFLWPLFLGLPFLAAGSNDPDMIKIKALLASLINNQNPQAAPIMLAAVFGLAVFVTGTSGLAESALSREGRHFYMMKILPMSYTRQIAAKLGAAMLLNLSGLLVSLAMVGFYLKLPGYFVALSFLTFPGALLVSNLSGIVFELYWPKLNWDNEQRAVKQNMNALYGILVSLLLAGLSIAPVILLHVNLLTTAVLVIIMPLLLSFLLLIYLRKLIPRRMLAIPG